MCSPDLGIYGADFIEGCIGEVSRLLRVCTEGGTVAVEIASLKGKIRDHVSRSLSRSIIYPAHGKRRAGIHSPPSGFGVVDDFDVPAATLKLFELLAIFGAEKVIAVATEDVFLEEVLRLKE